MNLKACVVCFSSGVKLYSLNTGQLRQEFNLVSGIQTYHGDGMLDYLCFQCIAVVRRFSKFRDKCHRAHNALKEILSKNKKINQTNLKVLNRNLGIMPPLSFVTLDKTHYEPNEFLFEKQTPLDWCNTSKDNMVVAHYSTFTSDGTDEVTNTEELEFTKDKIKIDIDSDHEEFITEYQAKDEPSGSDGTPDNTEVADTFSNDQLDSNNDQDQFKFLDITFEDWKTAINGTKTDEEYATLVPMSEKEANAANEVDRMFSQGKYKCEMCNKAYSNKRIIKIHSRIHDKHVSGNFYCSFCQFYYKTKLLLMTHMTEKHLFKYLCTECPEVSFYRTSAKQHYNRTHLQKDSKLEPADRNQNCVESKPKQLKTKGGKRVQGNVTLKPTKRDKKLPDDFLICSPIGHEEQYKLIEDRQQTRSYQAAKYQCTLCYRGFGVNVTYNNHVKKHDPEKSGPIQCDICKLHYKNKLKLYKHVMHNHVLKYSCQLCSYVCYNRCQAHTHYKWHRNFKYECPHCEMEFMKASTRHTHIRKRHPSMCLCNICGCSFVSEAGLHNHKKMSHSAEEIEKCINLKVDTSDPHYCADCEMQFMSFAAFTMHFRTSNKHTAINWTAVRYKRPKTKRPSKRQSGRQSGRPRLDLSIPYSTPGEIVNKGISTSSNCEVCGVLLASDMQAHEHYKSEHPKYNYLKRYMCDVCGHTTRLYTNLILHMRTHTDERPYTCPHCDRRFTLSSNRDRHLVVHTGERPFECQHCNRRFTQKSSVKLHIQTVHMKIPYPPWNKKNRKRRKELETAGESTPLILPPPPQKLAAFETPGDYLNAYITYNDE